ncbi:DUF4190 domain-containing protein [Nocardia flavorosea]|uniref:DUF4190 domain-containing protein n=1 Tax=Nocardia flavorosea TaxID=53429 RepID=A0A846YFQ5_9NOCA|nr:DUF4190 domain-containing protein [Nocardia flavorosea]NKY55988.1 DUF4190 domain-containing protein [Nocardia flavorosea]
MVIPNTPIGKPVEHPYATAVLLLGAVSLLCFGLTGPVAWAMGKRALDQIDESGGAYGGRTQVVVGFTLGVIGTILAVLMALLFVLVFITGG